MSDYSWRRTPDSPPPRNIQLHNSPTDHSRLQTKPRDLKTKLNSRTPSPEFFFDTKRKGASSSLSSSSFAFSPRLISSSTQVIPPGSVQQHSPRANQLKRIHPESPETEVTKESNKNQSEDRSIRHSYQFLNSAYEKLEMEKLQGSVQRDPPGLNPSKRCRLESPEVRIIEESNRIQSEDCLRRHSSQSSDSANEKSEVEQLKLKLQEITKEKEHLRGRLIRLFGKEQELRRSVEEGNDEPFGESNRIQSEDRLRRHSSQSSDSANKKSEVEQLKLKLQEITKEKEHLRGRLFRLFEKEQELRRSVEEGNDEPFGESNRIQSEDHLRRHSSQPSDSADEKSEVEQLKLKLQEITKEKEHLQQRLFEKEQELRRSIEEENDEPFKKCGEECEENRKTLRALETSPSAECKGDEVHRVGRPITLIRKPPGCYVLYITHQKLDKLAKETNMDPVNLMNIFFSDDVP